MKRFSYFIYKTTTPLAILAVSTLNQPAANALSITLNVIDSGWYSNPGFHESTNENYVVGRRVFFDYNNFFLLDLSGIDFAIESAELQIFNPAGAYRSIDPTETYTLFDVSTPVSTLRAGGFPLSAIYADLGSGVSFGSQTISAVDNNAVVTIPLNAAGVASLNNARGGLYALGGSITTLSGSETQSAFESTGFGSIRQLIVTTVPEPSTLTLLSLGVFSLLGLSHRRRDL